MNNVKIYRASKELEPNFFANEPPQQVVRELRLRAVIEAAEEIASRNSVMLKTYYCWTDNRYPPFGKTVIVNLEIEDGIVGCWIPVSLAKPKDGQMVLGYHKNGTRDYGIGVYMYHANSAYWQTGAFEGNFTFMDNGQDITHWMTMPAPPSLP
jgi:hypothetical protein